MENMNEEIILKNDLTASHTYHIRGVEGMWGVHYAHTHVM